MSEMVMKGKEAELRKKQQQKNLKNLQKQSAVVRQAFDGRSLFVCLLVRIRSKESCVVDLNLSFA